MNRIASIIFSRELMRQGVSNSNMEDLFAELPEGTKILGFGEDICRNIMQINISHDKFKEVEVGSVIPEIIANFTVDEDGVEDCELDLSAVLEDGYEFDNSDYPTKIVSTSKGTPYGYSGMFVDETSTHTLDAFRHVAFNTGRAFGKTSRMILAGTPPENANLPEDYLKKMEEEVRKGVGLNPDFLVFDETCPVIEEASCSHEYKQVQGIYNTYSICKHCGEKE